MPTKIALLGASILLLSSSFSVFAQSEDIDELSDFLDTLLADEELPADPKTDKKDPKNDATTQSAEDIQKELNGTNEAEKKNNDLEGALDEANGDDHDSAQDILDEDEKWTYQGGLDSKIQVSKIDSDAATFKISKVLYENKAVEKYRIYYSEKSLTSQKLSLIKDVEVTKVDDSDPNMVQVSLANLTPGTKYYVVVSPIHPTDPTIEPLDVITKEIFFETKTAAPPAEEKKEEPAAADPKKEEKKEEPVATGPGPNDIVLKNVSYTNKDNQVVLKWNGADKNIDRVEVNLRHQGESNYTKIGTPNFSAATFTFNVTKSGNYFLKLKGLDKAGKALGKEHIQTVKVAEVKNPTENKEAVVTNPPKVGPAVDLLVGLFIFAMMLYMMMRFRRKV